MKKTILILAAILMGITSMQAQESVYFGIKGGANFATFAGDGVDDFDNPKSRTAFNLGLLAEIPVSEKFSIQPEVLYSGQGYDISHNEDGDDVEYQLDYINIPVLAKFYLIDGLAIELGPQVGFLVNTEIDYKPSSFNEGNVSLNEDQFNSVDFSAALGLSYKFRGGFFVNGRYTAGLSDIYDDTFTNNVFAKSDARHSVFQAGIGLLF